MTDTNGRVETAEEFAERMYPTFNPRFKQLLTMLEARDAAIAHAAKVEVLRDAYQSWLSNPSTSARERQSDISRQYWDGLAARHNVTAAELEPEKPYTEADVKVEQLPASTSYMLACGPFRWSRAGWVPGVFDEHSKHDAEAIRDRIIKDGNYPGGGK